MGKGKTKSGVNEQQINSAENDKNKNINDKKLVDYATFLVVNEKKQTEIYASKTILSKFCPKFKEIFDHSKENEEILIKDMKEKDVNVFISFIQNNRVKFWNLSQAWNLLKLSERFECQKLHELSMQYIMENTNVQNVTEIYRNALDIQNEKLILETFYFILREAEEIFKENRIRGLSSSTLQLILSQGQMNIKNESQLFDAVLYWVKTELKDKENVAGRKGSLDIYKQMMPFLGKFRFLSMTCTEFMEGPAKSGILTEEQIFQIKDIIVNNKRINTCIGSYRKDRRKWFSQKNDFHIDEDTLINYCQHKEQSELSCIRNTFRSKGQAMFISAILLRDSRKWGQFTIKVGDNIKFRKILINAENDNEVLGIIELDPPIFIRRDEIFEFIFVGVNNILLYSCENPVNFENAPFCPVSTSVECDGCTKMTMHCFFWAILYFVP